MKTWIWLPTLFPADAQTVWVRTHPYDSAPFLATFTLATLEFTPPWLTPKIPWTAVVRWRP